LLPAMRCAPTSPTFATDQSRIAGGRNVRLRHVAMGVQVNGPNALSIDNDFTSPLRRLRQGGVHQAASDRRKPGQCAGSLAEHFSTVRDHLRFPRWADIPWNPGPALEAIIRKNRDIRRARNRWRAWETRADAGGIEGLRAARGSGPNDIYTAKYGDGTAIA
jgi:hypothetical protein